MKFIKEISLLLIFVFLLCIPVKGFNYSSQDLWIIEAVLNDSINASQMLDALIIDDKAYLPLVEICDLLKINLDCNYQKGNFVLHRPEDDAIINIRVRNKEVLIGGELATLNQEFYYIEGKVFFDITDLEKITNTSIEYNASKLIIYINAEYLVTKKEEEIQDVKKIKEEDANPNPAFTISNINYNYQSDGEYRKNTIQGLSTEETSWGHALDLDIQGSLYDWRYYFSGLAEKLDTEDVEFTLDNLQLEYDLDNASFIVGTNWIETEKELSLENKKYYGVMLTSIVSPLMRMNGNMIDISGKAPIGSKVTLYLDDWKQGEITVSKQDGTYCFKDIVLTSGKRANEIHVNILKPSGGVEDTYRYIAVSDALLNKDEVNYLVQFGKKDAEKHEADYLLNSIIYWGVTDRATLDLGWYSELNDNATNTKDLLKFNYNSMRLNYRLADNWILKNILYHQYLNQDQYKGDFGYKTSLDYKDDNKSVGLEYHKEGKQFKENNQPNQAVKLFYIQDITADSLIKGKVSSYHRIEDWNQYSSDIKLEYQISKDKWKGSIGTEYEESQYNKLSSSHSINTAIQYYIRPNAYILNRLEYKAKWNEILTEKLQYQLEGYIERDDSSLLAGLGSERNLTTNDSVNDIKVSYSKNWRLSDYEYISAGMGLEYQFGDESEYSVPLRVGYHKRLANDSNLGINYTFSWDQGEDWRETNHYLTLSLDGAFNIFGGKVVSTSPFSTRNKVGMVKGIVYNDKNRNGQKDPDESLISDIPVCLGRRVEYTDEKGKFVFKQVPVGSYSLQFDYDSLPIQLTPVNISSNVDVKVNDITSKNMGLYVVGMIDGQLKINSIDTEKDLSGIKLTLNPGKYVSYTDRSGYYYFDQIPPGEYQLNIDSTSLPDWILTDNIPSKEIIITEEGEYIKGQDFDLAADLSQQDKEQIDSNSQTQKNTEELEEDNDLESPIEDEEKLVEVANDILEVDLNSGEGIYKEKEVFLRLFMENEKVWASIRNIAEIFEAKIYWNNDEKKIYIVDQEKSIIFDIYLGYVVRIDGQDKDLRDGIRLKEGRTFITLHDLEQLGYDYEIIDHKLYIYRQK